jgi:hypothetical protein
MNTLTAIVLGLVAWLFFLSNQSFLALLTLCTLVLYLGVSGGGRGSSDSAAAAPSSEREGAGNSKVDRFAEQTGDLVNVVGRLVGGFFSWAFKGEGKEEKKAEFEPEFQVKTVGHTSTILRKK